MGSIALAVFLAGCSEQGDPKSRKVEGEAQAMATPKTSDAANADNEGVGAKGQAEETTESVPGELMLTPSTGDGDSTTPQPGETPAAERIAPTGPDAGTTTTAGAALAPAGPVVADAAPAEAEAPVDLAQSSSPYLRAAAKSPVRWSAYSASALKLAAEQKRPVLMDIGTQSNQLSRKMAEETYADAAVAEILNEKFVCLKVDGWQQPDLQTRYANAHRIIHNSEAAFPLTVFALPDGRPFEVVSYLPAKGEGSEAGMAEVLKQVLQLYSEQPEEIGKQADLVVKNLEKLSSGDPAGSFDAAALKQLSEAMAKAESLPHDSSGAAAMYLLHYGSDTGSKAPVESASNLLLEKFRSKLRDHVLGGYFLEVEGTPRYEKVLPVQAQLLSANALAFAGTKKALHKEAAQEILRFCRDTLESPNGGFYAGQDSDSAVAENGAYFTWTRDEILKLGGDGAEARVFAQYLNAGNDRSALHVTQRLQTAADANGLSYNDANKGLNTIRMKLRDARMQQENVPFVNKAMVTGWTAEMICAYLDAYRYLGDTQARDFALQSADYLINNAVSEKEGVARILYKDAPSQFGHLEDNVKMAAALLQCFQVSAQREYLESAESLLGYVEAKFLDSTSGLYRDSLAGVSGGQMPMLALNYYPIADEGTLGSNAVAAQCWYELYQALAKDEYQERAKRIVDAAGALTGLDISRSGTLGRAASLVVNGAPKVLIIGAAGEAGTQKMHEAALPVFRMGKLVEVLTPEEAAGLPYPAAKDGSAIAYVCTSKNCAPPVKDAAKLADVIRTFGRNGGGSSNAGEGDAPTVASNGRKGSDGESDVN